MLGFEKKVKIRKGQESVELSKSEFCERYKKFFFDPNFAGAAAAVDQISEIAWQNYQQHRKAPITVKAGPSFADPNYDLSAEWLNTHQRLIATGQIQKKSRSKILLICGSPRNEHTCPSEESKTHRLILKAKEILHSQDFETDFLDLSLLTAEFGKVIHPCKACVSTAMPLCHWPCSCYPNHALGQSPDWMAEIYERWMAAHGIMIITPVHWYGAPSGLKLMMDRLVCADGGNPDPTSTHGKDPEKAKQLELAGWPYPKHLAGRAFSVVVHGDAAGAENLCHSLVDWLTDLQLTPAGASSQLAKYIGYYEPYATSHDSLDKDKDLFTEVENAALSLARQVSLIRSGQFLKPDEGLKDPQPK